MRAVASFSSAARRRVPYADANCIDLPGDPGDEYEDDFVLLAGAFVTGWHATELAEVGPREQRRGLRRRHHRPARCLQLAAQGASEVCVIDFVRDRLDKAAEIGATAVDLSAGDPVDQVRELRRSRQVRRTCETWSLPVGHTPVPTEMVRLPIRGADLIATTPE
jgi:hypothetical protein